MEKGNLKDVSVRLLEKTQAVPYELLLDADPSMAAIENYIKVSEIYVALLHGKVIAVLALYPLNSDALEIKNIAVEERFQGNGIGKLLLKEATQIAIKKGMRVIVIGTSNSAIAQLYLYQRNGFEITGIKFNFFLDNYPEPIFENGIQGKHMIIMEKKLK